MRSRRARVPPTAEALKHIPREVRSRSSFSIGTARMLQLRGSDWVDPGTVRSGPNSRFDVMLVSVAADGGQPHASRPGHRAAGLTDSTASI